MSTEPAESGSAGGPLGPPAAKGRAADAVRPHAPDVPAVGIPDGETPPVRRARDAELAAGGWVRRFTGSPPRLVEVKELYESTGQEVLLDEVLPGELAPECEGCTLALSLFKVIYTRRPETG